jgi:ATP synthase protein I
LICANRTSCAQIPNRTSAFIGWVLGAWADKALHQDWIGIAGIAFGGIAGLVYVIRLVLSTGTDSKSAAGNSGKSSQ